MKFCYSAGKAPLSKREMAITNQGNGLDCYVPNCSSWLTILELDVSLSVVNNDENEPKMFDNTKELFTSGKCVRKCQKKINFNTEN